MGNTFVIALLLIVCSAFFSGTEVAMFGLRRVDREQMARSKRRSHQLVMSMLSRPRALITTILIGNESINVSMSAVMAGAAPLLLPGASETQLAMVATGLALPLLLFIGEITPKTIAFKHPKRWAEAASRPLWLFRTVVTPVRIVVGTVAAIIVRPLGGGGPRPPPRALSEAEFKALVDAGSAEGQVDARERRLIHKVFEFGDKTVAEAMVPRDQVFALSYDLPVARLTQEVAGRQFSRVPIYQKSLDNVRGVLHAKDLLTHSGAQLRRLSQILHEPLFVPQTTPLERLFRLFKQRKIHMALVVNEYGKLAGLVTMDDLLEQLLGDIRGDRADRRSAEETEPSPPAQEGGAG